MEAVVLSTMSFGCGDSTLVGEKRFVFRERTVKNDFGAEKMVADLWLFYHCQVFFQSEQIYSVIENVTSYIHLTRFLPFFVIETFYCHIWNVLLFLVNLHKNIIIFFLDPIVQKNLKNQMAAAL